MAGVEKNKLSAFMESGIYRFSDSNSIFLDPVRMLNRNYSQFRVSPSSYYSRFFTSNLQDDEFQKSGVSPNCRKRKRNPKKNNNHHYALNQKETLAEQRHQEIRPLLVKAHNDTLQMKELLEVMCQLNCETESWEPCIDVKNNGRMEGEVSFVELGKVWQAPLYEIALDLRQANNEDRENGGSSVSPISQGDNQRILPIFNNLVLNETNEDVVAEFLTSRYILPKASSFYMSDLAKIQNMIPEDSDLGFNFILIDPPWENRSAYQKSMYPTLPNRYFLSIPIRQLSHTKGALVALWVTNREKLRNFVENELFPAWGVRYAATLYWLKVKGDGSLICDLDLFHHRPYECLLIGYSGVEVIDSELMSMAITLKDKVVITIPGDYSRKPPIGELLMEHVPGPRPARCIELFARELMSGWKSWGNEPLLFQDQRYFSRNMTMCTS